MHVKDVANAFYLAAVSKKVNKIYNLGAEARKSFRFSKNGWRIWNPKRPGEPHCTWANIKKFKRDIKWKPTIPFKEGVEEMINNIDQWKNAPLWNTNSIKKATNLWFKHLK